MVEKEDDNTTTEHEELKTESEEKLITPCTQAAYDVHFWEKSRKQLAQHTSSEDPGWYNKETANGKYQPTEADGTCGDTTSFGYIVCPKGQQCAAKQGAYPFIAAIGV